MNALLREARLFLRSGTGVGILALLAVLTALAVTAGLREVHHQQQAIERVLELQRGEEAAIARFATDAGTAAYYTFVPTWSAPSGLAFAALGQRDVAPYVLRVRALALEAQLYESETFNPELALQGRFDYAFVLVYLAPLVLIALLHDLVSGERERGRLAVLHAHARSLTRLWWLRAAVRTTAVLAALLAPLLVGAALAGATLTDVVVAVGITAASVAFWSACALWVATRGWNSGLNATVLAATWFALVLVLPTAAHRAVNAAMPVPSGAELARENREAVHDAWDLPRQPTLDRFLAAHPEWSPTAPLTGQFHWKWYFAFQQLGDEHVAELSRAYRDGIAARERVAAVVGWVLPPIGLQRALHARAGTDVTAQLEYLARVRAYHAELRSHFYPFLFHDRPFEVSDLERLPRFRTDTVPATLAGS